MQKSFPLVLPKTVYQVSLRVHIKSARKKPAMHKNTSPEMFSKQKIHCTTLRGKRGSKHVILWHMESGYSSKVFSTPVIKQLSNLEQFAFVLAFL